MGRCRGNEAGESFEGWLCFTTSIGEYKLPFTVQVQTEEVKSAGRKVSSLEEFLHIAKEDFHEAYRIFTERHFSLILSDQSEKIRSLYAGMSQQPVTYQHLEEFLIAAGAKEKVTLSLNREEAGFMMSVNLFRNPFISTGADGDTCGQILR